MARENTKRSRKSLTQHHEDESPVAADNVKSLKQLSKRAKQRQREREEEERLTALIFGAGPSVAVESVAGNGHVLVPASLSGSTNAPPLFEIDRIGANGGGIDTDSVDNKNDKDSDVKSARDNEDDADGDHSDKSDDDDPPPPVAAGTAAWIDEDDQQVSVDLLNSNRLRKLRTSRAETDAISGVDFTVRLRQRYQDTAGRLARTDWAQLPSTTDDSPDDNNNAVPAISSSEPLLLHSTRRRRLPPQRIQMVRCPDANLTDPNAAVVRAVHFYPASLPHRPLLLTAGLDKTLRFFQVGGGDNDDGATHTTSTKVHGVHFPKLPIYSASFLGNTGNVVVSGRRPFFYLHDTVAGHLDLVPQLSRGDGTDREKSLETCVASPDGRTLAFCGNDGYVLLYSVAQKRLMTSLKLNGSVRAVAFAPDASAATQLVASGSDGDVYRWDLRQQRQCLERFANDDGTITSCLAWSSAHRLAVGAESGVVNLYDQQPTTSRSSSNSDSAPLYVPRRRAPLKSIMNLRTSADALSFNHDGQILALSTRRERHAGLKLLHVPTQTVFDNWPTSKTPLDYVFSHDFSPDSRFLAVGNDKGKCLLYRLSHYESDDPYSSL